MIPYETVRAHLDAHHWWTPTDGLTWRELVELHAEKHEAPLDHPAPPHYGDGKRPS